MFETHAATLFHGFVNDLVTTGWTVEQVLPHAYVLVDSTGVSAFASCHVEQYLNYDRYSVFVKLNSDLVAVGTVAKIDGQWQTFNLGA